ncbi:MAG: hypothetical protein SGPRY_008576 [Prymnesium sp.]
MSLGLNGLRMIADKGELSDGRDNSLKRPHWEWRAHTGDGSKCTVVNFRHIVKTGGTTVRSWMTTVALLSGRALIRDKETMFCPLVDTRSRKCAGTHDFAQVRLWARMASRRRNHSTIMVESHNSMHVFSDIMQTRDRGTEGPLERPWPSFLGCKAVVAVLWREPSSMYYSWYRYILFKHWGTLHIAFVHQKGCLKQADNTCEAGPLPFSNWIFNRTEHYRSVGQLLGAPPNMQTVFMLTGSAKRMSYDEASALRSGRELLQKVDLAGTTEDMSTFLLLLCQLSGIHTCPQYTSTNINSHVPANTSDVNNSDVKEYIRSRLAPVDHILYAEVKARFYKQAEPFENEVRAYRAAPVFDLPFKWQFCSDDANVFQQGLRVQQRVARNRSSGLFFGNVVLSPINVQVENCTNCKLMSRPENMETCRFS